MTHFIRKTALTGILGIALLFAEKSAAQTADTLTEKEKTQFDLHFLFKAMGEFPQSATPARNAYSSQLDSLRRIFVERRSKRHYTNYTIIDPVVMDVCQALGFNAKFGVTMVAEQDGVNAAENIKDAAANAMTEKLKTKYDDHTTTTSPSIIYNELLREAQGALIIPSDFAHPYRISGMGYKKTQEFINLHEAFHTTDSTFIFGDMDLSVADNYHFDFFRSLHGEKEPLAIYAVINRREAFADIAAIGQMIRNGDGIDILNAVREWRRGMPDNVKHMSVPVLDAFEKHLKKHGIDKFRAMTDDEATAFYINIVDKHAQTTKSLNTSLDVTESRFVRRAGVFVKSIFDGEVRKGREFARLRQGAEVEEDGKLPLSQLQQVVEKEIENWDALKDLQDRAFQNDSLLTPQTVIRAYGQMQGEFIAKADLNAYEYELNTAKMVRLRATFIEHLEKIEYAALNAARGIPVSKIMSYVQENTP